MMDRSHRPARLSLALVLGAMLLGGASASAQSPHGGRYAYPEERPVYRTPLEVWLSGEGWDEDYTSSDVCVYGYRWITRHNSQSDQSAAADAYPVRC